MSTFSDTNEDTGKRSGPGCGAEGIFCFCTLREAALTWEMWLIEDSMRRSWEAWMSNICRTLLAKVLMR